MPTKLRHALLAVWSGLDPGLRRLLRLALPCLLLTAAWSLIWVPCQQARQRLSMEQPVLRQQLEQMLGEAAALRRAEPPSSADTGFSAPDIAQLKASLQAQGLDAGQWQGQGPQWQLQLHGASYTAWIHWLQIEADRHHLHLRKARIRTAAGSGIVDIEAVIEQSAEPEA